MSYKQIQSSGEAVWRRAWNSKRHANKPFEWELFNEQNFSFLFINKSTHTFHFFVFVHHRSTCYNPREDQKSWNQWVNVSCTKWSLQPPDWLSEYLLSASQMLSFMYAHLTFFHQGYDLFSELQPLMKLLGGQVKATVYTHCMNTRKAVSDLRCRTVTLTQSFSISCAVLYFHWGNGHRNAVTEPCVSSLWMYLTQLPHSHHSFILNPKLSLNLISIPTLKPSLSPQRAAWACLVFRFHKYIWTKHKHMHIHSIIDKSNHINRKSLF